MALQSISRPLLLRTATMALRASSPPTTGCSECRGDTYIAAPAGLAASRVITAVAPGTLVPAGGAIVVFGGGMPVGFPANVVTQTATLGTLGFKNTSVGDNVILRTPDGTTDLINDHYRGSGEAGGQEWIPQVSLQNENENDLSLPPTYVQHNVYLPGTDVSPGTNSDGTTFP